MVLENSNNQKWVSVAIALSDELYSENQDESIQLLNEAIEYAILKDYPILLAQAYQTKGLYAYSNNKVLSGITFYQKALDLFSSNRYDSKSAASLYGIAQGLSRIRKNNESSDTLRYVLKKYNDSITPDFKSEIFHLISANNLELGENEIGIQYLDSAIEIEKGNAMVMELANSYNSLGSIYQDIGDFKNALFYYDKFESISRDLQDTLLISYALYNKALIYLTWGVYDEALELFLQSKSLTRSIGKDYESASSISSIADIYSETKNVEKAKYYYLESIKLSNEYNNLETKNVALHNLGELMYTLGKYDTALILLNQSMKIEMETQNTLGIAQSKNMIATVYIALEKYPLAFEYFKEAEDVFKKFGSKLDLASLYIQLGKGHASLKNDSLSVQYFKQGIELAKQINARGLTLEAQEAASENYERIGDYKKALMHYKAFKVLNDSIFNDNNQKRLDYLSLRLEKQENEKELEQLENEKKLLKADQKTKNIQLVAAISFIFLILIFFSIMYYLIKKSESRIKQQYQVLLESEQKIKALLDASFDSTILVDKDGIIRAANNNSLSGFLPDIDLLVNKPIISLFEETNQKVLQKYIELVYSSKLYKELRIHEKNNIILNTKISPVQNITGEVISLAFYIQDITQIESDKLEKKQMEEQLIQTQKMETIGTLAGGIAHDFNNYLATIKGYVSMSLEDSQEGSSIYNYLSKTMKAVNLSQGTVQKLLTFSRSKEMELNKFKIKDLITDSIDIVKGSKPKNIQFNYEIPDMELELLGEKNQLTQVLLNICTNAFHAIEAENGGLVNVYIEPPHIIPDLGNKQCICIKIEDNGIGMQKETLERIFEPFYTTKDVGKGTGLGLSVVTGIIKQHGGKIEVHSEFGKGSLFSLYLPIIS
jgi:PAS domain S-box-containing protein